MLRIWLIKKIGYIRVNRFAATTGKEFADALHRLQKEGMRDLILDLQGNGGGYLNAAIELANQFLGKKELIVYTEDVVILVLSLMLREMVIS